jgi:hypothetical protein
MREGDERDRKIGERSGRLIINILESKTVFWVVVSQDSDFLIYQTSGCIHLFFSLTLRVFLD